MTTERLEDLETAAKLQIECYAQATKNAVRADKKIAELRFVANIHLVGIALLVIALLRTNGDIFTLKARLLALEKAPRSVQITYTPPAHPEPRLNAALLKRSGLKADEFDSLPGFEGLRGRLTVLKAVKREVAKR